MVTLSDQKDILHILMGNPTVPDYAHKTIQLSRYTLLQTGTKSRLTVISSLHNYLIQAQHQMKNSVTTDSAKLHTTTDVMNAKKIKTIINVFLLK